MRLKRQPLPQVMGSNGNYPPGAQHDPAAPWNEPKKVLKKVTVSVTYSQEVEVEVWEGSSIQDIGVEVREQIMLPKTACAALAPVMHGKIKETLLGWGEDDFAVAE